VNREYDRIISEIEAKNKTNRVESTLARVQTEVKRITGNKTQLKPLLNQKSLDIIDEERSFQRRAAVTRQELDIEIAMHDGN
jgi:predicted  nucleic acid-binding Zn-ribbon protein